VLSRPLGGELTQARLQLASAARTALGTGLQLLGVTAPGRM
jgi:arginyl-tRNA synthetase